MNQEQRKYLIEQVNKTHTRETRLLEKEAERVVKPSLNNYLIAAVFDNSFQLKDVVELREKIKARVLKFGKNDKIVTDGNNDSWSSRNKEEDSVTLPVEDLFVIPEAYKVELEKYKAYKKAIKLKELALDAQRDTIIMKIQIGSNAILDKLIMQVDNLGDLDLTNTQLALNSTPKQIGND